MVNQQNQMLRAGQQMNSNKPAVPGVTANNGVNSPSNMQRNPPAVNAMNKPAMRQMANSGAASPANRMSTQSPVNTSKGKPWNKTYCSHIALKKNGLRESYNITISIPKIRFW